MPIAIRGAKRGSSGQAAAEFVLEDLVVQTPCPMDWEKMEGNERQRFCSRCEKDVYDISQLSREEAISLIAGNEGRVCARLFKRPDGTVVTRPCAPVAGRVTGRRFQFSLAALAAVLTSSAGLFAATPWIGRKLEPLVQRWFGDPPPPPAQCFLGSVAVMPNNVPANNPAGSPALTWIMPPAANQRPELDESELPELDGSEPVPVDLWPPAGQ